MMYKKEVFIGASLVVLVGGGAYFVNQRSSKQETVDTTGIEKLLVFANQLYVQGDFEKALYVYADILKTNPDSTGVIYNFGLCLYKLGKHEQAIGVFSELIAREPEHTMAYYQRGRALNEHKDFNNALADFSKVVELAPNAQMLRIEMAKISSSQGTFNGYAFAVNQLAWAIKQNPEDYNLVLELANVQKNNGHADEAIKLYHVLLDGLPKTGDAETIVNKVKQELASLATNNTVKKTPTKPA